MKKKEEELTQVPSTWAEAFKFETSEAEATPEAQDTINSLAFSQCGEHIAVGDKAGRVWIYSTPKGRILCRPGKHYEKIKMNGDMGLTYEFYGQFQSHEPEFDYLKSLDIEEKINDIVWCPRTNNSLHLLATNDKTIKLWKIFEKPASQPSFKCSEKDLSKDGLHCPEMMELDTITAAIPRRIFANKHAYHINSISPSSDYETFLSADDLRINLWHLDSSVKNSCFELVDLKPEDMNDLKEVITCAKYHPIHGNILAYSSSRGFTYLCDLRTNAKIEKPSKSFGVTVDDSEASFFTEILVSVSDMSFSSDGNFLLARDFLTVKVWDVRMEKHPYKSLPLHPQLNDRLCDIYENDCIFDRFTLSSGANAKPYVISGSYGNRIKLVDWDKNEIQTLNLDNPSQLPEEKKVPIDWEARYTKKVLHCQWHPNQDCFAVASGAAMYVYQPKVEKAE